MADPFTNATGFSPEELSTLIKGIVVAALFAWAAWVAMSNYSQWAKKENGVTMEDVIHSAVRSILLISLVLYIVN